MKKAWQKLFMPNLLNLKRFIKTRKVAFEEDLRKMKKAWQKLFMPNLLNLKRFIKTRKVTFEVKTLSKDMQIA